VAVTPPGVNTDAATDITFDSATLNGNLTSPGTAAAVNVSFEYGLTDSYGSIIAVDQAMTASGTFNAGLSGLISGATITSGPGRTVEYMAPAQVPT